MFLLQFFTHMTSQHPNKKTKAKNHNVTFLIFQPLLLGRVRCKVCFIPKAFGKAQKANQLCHTLHVTWMFVILHLYRVSHDLGIHCGCQHLLRHFLKRAQIQTNPLILHMKAKKRAALPPQFLQTKALHQEHIPDPDQHFQSKKINNGENVEVGEIYCRFCGPRLFVSIKLMGWHNSERKLLSLHFDAHNLSGFCQTTSVWGNSQQTSSQC